MSDPTTSYPGNSLNGLEIAVVGLSGRFPGAKNVAQFWQNLCEGKESISFFTPEELEQSGVDLVLMNDPNHVRAGGILADSDQFDAAFFGFSPREAEILDPQHRLFLECAWEALEDAGYDPHRYDGSIGVYGGARLSSYLLVNLFPNRDRLLASVSPNQILLGNDPGNLTTRVSYKLNLEGPSCTIETACSTSLVAVHLACQSVLNGECDIALAGGVGVSAQQKSGYRYQEGDILSPDGHCRAFDAQANGTVGGNGVGIVALKRLEDAIADGDCIRAVIKGSAINNDGALKVSYTAPRIDSQAKVIQAAQAIADVDPATITYIEAHGTGTALGDPIEIAALTQAFQLQTGCCAIGSVKTNIGHLGVAAGVTGLIKTILALQHRKIPPSLHFQQPNSRIDFTNSPFYVNTTLTDWQSSTPRRAGVSSFGMGGTNAHVVLEEAPILSSGASRSHQLLLLSAKTPSALDVATRNLADHLQQARPKLADVAYTLQVGRQAFDHRRAIVCQDLDDAVNALKHPDSPSVFTNLVQSPSPQLVFMFPGQGSQYGDMGRELYDTEPGFQEQVDQCCQLLKPHLGLDLRDILYPQAPTPASSLLTQTRYAQPAIFVIEYALAQLWMSWGVKPSAMIGHSIGEYVAACLSGVFSLDDALKLVAMRGRLMQQIPPGSMLAVSLCETELQPFLNDEVTLAAHNAPCGCVVSGVSQAIQTLSDRLTQQGITCRLLHTSHAFHSPMMNPILEPFLAQVNQVFLQAPNIPFISNVMGTWITPAEATNPHYWVKHLRQTVRFTEGIKVLQSSAQILLEVGPGRTLSTLAKQTLDGTASVTVLSSLRHPQEQQSDVAFLLQTLGKLWLTGGSINWQAFSAHEQRRRSPLPTYPFERQRYWIEPSLSESSALPSTSQAQPLDVADWFYLPTWKQTVPPDLLQPRCEQQPQCWLIFADTYGIGQAIATRLHQQNKTVITVTCSREFTHINEDEYGINPQHRADYDTLIQSLADSHSLPDAVIHLWNLATTTGDDSPDTALGFNSLLYFTQAIGQQAITKPLQLRIITNSIYDIVGDEVLCPTQATSLGLCKVIPQEYPHITCHSIDVSLSITGTSRQTGIQRIAEQICVELTTSVDLVVAYRGNHRWIQDFEAVQLTDTKSQYMRDRGVYIITGGFGKLGLTFATYLAQTVKATLVLMSRSGLPERSLWPQWLETYPDQDVTRSRIQQIQRLEHLGAKVLVIQADVGDEAQLQRAIAQVYQQCGDIHGVIHAAGIAGDRRTIQDLTLADCQRQFQAKVNGVLTLEKVLRGKSLDFCLLFSSLASVLGGLGFAAYAAANSFMDAVARRQRCHRDIPMLSINWDAWQVSTDVDRGAIADSTLVHAISPSEGIAAFERLLALKTLAQVVVSTSDLKVRMDQWLKLESVRATSSSQPVISPAIQSVQKINSRTDLEQTVASIWQQVLGVTQIGMNDNFFDLGGNSLSSIQVVAQLKQALNIQIPVVSLYERPTVNALAALLRQDDQEEAPLVASSTRGQKRRETKQQRR
ncbi:SDR family NAD(P)-dependent oxidoreductase [Oculatella sp. LEGE 06141]|uniref:type I polyketide synthase n=1 Tax=Oculatella sp. LEGE 06141 TaxID=1828648 RepID=UPI0018823E85|nr:type I polyketide synthase [Oculatella sp. LEGE 06141]MBE9178534.1 SDR family NAD(P)-dependent oxidoreductase [Oculatella sp. LEGE 06141]